MAAAEELTGRAFKVDELIRPAEGGIVSRAILKSGGGNVTLFAVAAGEEISEHTAAFDALAFVLDGAAQITVGGTTHMVRAGELLILPAHVPHGLRAEASFRMMLVMLRA
ncbi:MAG: cupin domain-containing protein [Candidatus Sumerlaeia bacterium]